MDHLDILADLIVPPTPAVVQAIESGLLALDATHVSPETATALMQHLCAHAVSAPPFVEAGETIFRRLLALGGDPWAQALPSQANAATAALQHMWQGPVVMALACSHPPMDSLMVDDQTPMGRSKGTTPVSWLRFAVRHGLHDVVSVLLEAGLDPNQCAPGEEPLLHTAPTYAQIIPLLLKHGADPNALDPQGRLCVQAWSQENTIEYVGMLPCVMDQGPGLDRFSLLRLAGGRPTACSAFLEGVKDPRALADDQGRSIFFHMAAACLDSRGSGLRTNKQILAHVSEALAWRRTSSLPQDPLDEGAARLLLWSARVLSAQSLNPDAAQAITKKEEACGLPALQPGNLLPYKNALASLDAMAQAGLLHDPSEVAATALGGYWKTITSNQSQVMAQLLSPEMDYPALQCLDRCFRGIRTGPWSQGQYSKHRWQNPDVPIERFRKDFLEFAAQAPASHPMWSNPDMGRTLIQMLRADWPQGAKRYYEMAFDPLEESWQTRLRARHEPLLNKMDQQALYDAFTDPCCHATVMAMDGKNCHIQSLVAHLEYKAIDQATPAAPGRSRSGPRL